MNSAERVKYFYETIISENQVESDKYFCIYNEPRSKRKNRN